MDFFNQHVLPPTREHLELLRYLLMLASLIELPFLGVVMGSASVSLFLALRDKDEANRTYALVAHDLMRMAMPSRVAVAVFGILPLPVIWIVYGQWFVHSAVNTMHLVPAGALIIIAGLVLLMRYRGTLRRDGQSSLMSIGVGGAGLACLLVGTYVLYGSVSRFFDPERWFLHYHAVRTLTAWSLIWRYLVFVAASLAMSGAAILFFFFRWPRDEARIEGAEARFVKNLGAGMAIAGSVFFPVFGFFYLVTLSVVAVSGTLYVLLGTAVALFFVIFVYAYRTLLSHAPRFGARVFVLCLVVFTLMIVGDQTALVNATREHTAGLALEAEQRGAEIDAKREAASGGAAVANPVQGEKVFKTVCSTCHRMSERLVGPALQAVLPKYAGNPDALVAFVRKPSKMNADYPPMPVLGLSLGDIKSVAAYLLAQAAPGDSTETGP